MFNIQLIRSNKEEIKENLTKRKFDITIIDDIYNKDEKWRKEISTLEELKQQKNLVSNAIKNNEVDDKASKIAEMQELNKVIKELEELVSTLKEEINNLILGVPNALQSIVPSGSDEEDNQLVRTWGEKRVFDFEPKEHNDILTELDLLDTNRATKLSGARFVVTKGLLSKLERALVSFMLDVHEETGYVELGVPFMVNSKTMQGTGQLPKFKEDLFKIEGEDKWLIPTAEVPVTNLYAGEIIPEDKLPISHTAFSACFRSEAGSAGRDTKGLIRLHQFNKVELVKFTKPEDSAKELETLTSNAEKILQLLNLPYRLMLLCSGDTGFSSSMTYDIEVWLPGANKYREISSCSNFGDFQARRAGIKYRDGENLEFIHTLNGSGLAVGRTIAAIVENYQNEDGTFTIPEALTKYM